MELPYFIFIFVFFGLCLVFAMVYIVEQYRDKLSDKPSQFRVKYLVILHDLISGKSLKSSAYQEIEAWNETEAISKVRELLTIRAERESKDLGASPYEYAEFWATKI